MYKGKVSSYNPKKKWFQVEFYDGDSEELNIKELERVLIPK